MQSKFFWKSWPAPYNSLYRGLLILALIGAVWFAYNYFSGTDSIIGWDILAKTEHTDVTINTFKLGPFTLSTTAGNPLFFQQYSGSLPEVNITSYYLFLVITVVCLILLFTVVSALPRFWYFAGTALFAFVLVNYKFELLLLFGSSDKWGLIIALLLFLPASYYFNSIKPETGFIKRLTVFFLITAVLALVIYLFADVEHPFLYLATYGIINPLIISLIFILMVAHEIIASFIYLLTRTSGPANRNTLVHFYIISAIYLINIALAYMHEANMIDWNIIYINLFLLLFTSALLGIWGFRQREEQYKYLFSFFPLGAISFIAMAIICFVSLGHFSATFNDPVIEVFRDTIIYAHVGYGLMFVIYITANFIDPLKRGLAVYKILYKPTSMPYFTFRFAGLIVFIALVLRSNWQVPVHQSMAAYYNGIADMHYYNRELALAETYYEEGAIFGYNNHKSNYMLGTLAHRRGDHVKAAVDYEAAIAKNPTPQSYVNLSNIYMEQSRFFDAVFALNEGLQAIPDNGEIQNNLGIAYAKTDILDTAAYYLNEAFESSGTQRAASSNMIALVAKNDIRLSPDSVLTSFEVADDPISLNNSYVLKNRAHEYLNKHYAPEDSALSFLESSIMYNAAFNHLFSEDSADINLLNSYAAAPGNANFREQLEMVAALNLYKNHNINRAFRQLNWLANTSTFNSGRYFNLAGLWALEQEAPYVGIDYFTWAADRNWNDAKFNLAIALTENGDLEQARNAWTELLSVGTGKVKTIARNLLQIINTSAKDYDSYSDQQKYLVTRYLTDYQDTARFNELIQGIKDNNYRGQAFLDMSKKLWNKDLAESAIAYFGKLSGLEISDQELFEKIQWYELKMLAAQGNIRGLSTKINQGITFDQKHALEKQYFTALINEASGDTTHAKINYGLIAYKNPFEEEATIAAANFLGIKDRFEAYNILLNALEINPKSVKLLKAYILQCARVQSSSYAENSLKDLKPLISKTAFDQFVNQYHELVNKVEEAEQNF